MSPVCRDATFRSDVWSFSELQFEWDDAFLTCNIFYSTQTGSKRKGGPTEIIQRQVLQTIIWHNSDLYQTYSEADCCLWTEWLRNSVFQYRQETQRAWTAQSVKPDLKRCMMTWDWGYGLNSKIIWNQNMIHRKSELWFRYSCVWWDYSAVN